MKKVIVKISGGSPKEYEAATVGEIRDRLGLGSEFQATLMGEPANDGTAFTADNQVLVYAKSVEGGQA